MKMTLKIFVAALISTLMVSTSYGKNHAEHRGQKSLKERLHKGQVHRKKHSHRLKKRAQKLRKARRRAMKDGQITPQERRQMKRQMKRFRKKAQKARAFKRRG